jgi:hypothetical protein|tara:strand:+ start:8896 stop:9282 length:387 start_codon:yes stop_codon:yes gene_type:complete
MLLFNWNEILKVSNGNVMDTITILRIITFKLTPKNYNDRVFKFYEHYYGGQSFLLNPEKLLNTGRSYSDREVVEYAGVASFRSYFEYQQTKDSTLDLLMLPISKDIITKNRLLDIKNGRIHFMFEETQ